tara:strand:- start:555 stop:1211 length:657 start_codon:yes stop_codon:yes gene_type:complete
MFDYLKNSFLAKLFVYLKMIIFKEQFSSSSNYWEERYKQNKTSGSGSYGDSAKFKSKILNDFINENDIKTVLELGCGDGNQLSLAKYPFYVGVDVSDSVIQKCKTNFAADSNKIFYNLSEFKKIKNNYTFDLSLSLDVIYHLVEDDVFISHINELFSSSKYVIIFSTDFDDILYQRLHVRNRKFTDFIKNNVKNYQLIKKIKNENKFSKVNFYIYKKV